MLVSQSSLTIIANSSYRPIKPISQLVILSPNNNVKSRRNGNSLLFLLLSCLNRVVIGSNKFTRILLIGMPPWIWFNQIRSCMQMEIELNSGLDLLCPCPLASIPTTTVTSMGGLTSCWLIVGQIPKILFCCCCSSSSFCTHSHSDVTS